MCRRRPVPVRLLTDTLAVKLPAGRASRSIGKGRTEWHQDFPGLALDRSGGMAFWLALDHLTPEQGTMQFFSGSHRLGSLGAIRANRGRTAFEPLDHPNFPVVHPLERG